MAKSRRMTTPRLPGSAILHAFLTYLVSMSYERLPYFRANVKLLSAARLLRFLFQIGTGFQSKSFNPAFSPTRNFLYFARFFLHYFLAANLNLSPNYGVWPIDAISHDRILGIRRR